MESATCCGMELARSDAWNQSEGERALIRASRDAMRYFVAIPYQTYGLDKKYCRKLFFSAVFFGGDGESRTHVLHGLTPLSTHVFRFLNPLVN